MKIATALVFAACLVLPTAAWPQDAPIKIDAAPLFSVLRARDWMGNRDSLLADAVQAALSKAAFVDAPGRGADVLTLAVPDGARKKNDEYSFTVVFSRDGAKLGEAVEYCPIKKLSDCTDQLVLDVKTAAQ